MTEKEDLFNHPHIKKERVRAKRPRYETMSAEKREELNDNKSRAKRFKLWEKNFNNHFNNPDKSVEPQTPKEIKVSDADILKRNLALKLLEEDKPKPQSGVNLWHKEDE